MSVKKTVSTKFNCSLERAFKAPMLGDATKFMTAFRFQPAIIDFEEDETWGNVKGMRYPISKGNFLVKKGRLLKDEILERRENEYWQWTIYNFETKSLFFIDRALGEWTVNETEPGVIDVVYSYQYRAKKIIYKPLTWLFVQFQVAGFMKRVIAGIKLQAESEEDFYYEKKFNEENSCF